MAILKCPFFLIQQNKSVLKRPKGGSEANIFAG